MLYFAVPRLSIFADGLEGTFSIVWLSFAIIVIAGNLTAMLYSPKRTANKRQQQKMYKKSRSF
jgi:lipopolysaccharide/colanic/teichoic acid biosynthesis glycosyltransferase